MRGIKSYLFFGVAASSLAAASPVWAQQTDDEIVVTAQRREQALQDVPIAVSAFSQEVLENAGATDIQSLQVTVPSLQMSRQANQARPFIRGVGAEVGDANNESSVAIYLDGVYQPAAFSNFFNFNNIRRVEVLRGPQGTLFGRNATGGVIQVITADPGDEPEADLSVGYASYETLSSQLYGSIPLGDQAGISLAAVYSHQDEGLGTNLTTGAETGRNEDVGLRMKFVLEPTPNTAIRLAANYQQTASDGIFAQPLPGAGPLPYPGEFNVYDNWPQRSVVHSDSLSLQVNHDFGSVQFESISAFYEAGGYWTLDQDLSPLPLLNAYLGQFGEMFTQEFHLLSPSDATFQWLIGAFYFDYEAGHYPLMLEGFIFDPTFPACLGGFTCSVEGFDFDNRSQTTSTALFAQGTYPIAANTNLTLGFRYTWDEVQGSSVVRPAGVPFVIDSAAVDNEYETPTWRISLDHEFSENVMGYVSYNRGTKSAGYGTGGFPATNLPYGPEQLDAYEIGLKTNLFDRHTRFNVAAYYYDYADIQFQQIILGSAHVRNGGETSAYGIDFDLEASVTDGLTIFAGGNVSHSEIDSFIDAPQTVRLPSGASINEFDDPFLFVLFGGDLDFDAHGNQLPGAPEVSGYLGFNYEIPTSVGRFDVSANAYHNGGYFTEVDNRLEVDPYTLLNASIRWTSPSDAFSVRLWGTNLTDEFYYTQMTGQSSFGTDLGAGPAQPTMYGITLEYHYN